MARITFDATINTRPFKQYLSTMTNAANRFFKEIKGKSEVLSEKIGSIGENFYLPIEPKIFKMDSLAFYVLEVAVVDGIYSRYAMTIWGGGDPLSVAICWQL